MSKRPVIISVIILFFSMSAVVAAATGDEMKRPPAPKAYYPEKVFQFAPVLEGQEVTHEFVVKNLGNAKLQIKRVKPG